MHATVEHRPKTTTSKQLEILEYGSLVELRTLLRQLDHHARAGGLRVLIVLDATFSGNLVSLVSRKCLGRRLVITTSAARLTGVEEVYKLKGSSWQEISVEADVERTIRREISTTLLSDRLIMFWP